MTNRAAAPNRSVDSYEDIKVQDQIIPVGLRTSIGETSSAYIDEQLTAITQRRAGRLNASSIGSDEVEELLEERKHLLEKQYSGGISDAERRRLAMIRWSLDRVDDARSGEVLDALEGAIVRYEALRQEIHALMSQLEEFSPKKRRG